MTERHVQPWPEARLIDALRAIEPEIAWPTVTRSDTGRDLAGAVRERIESTSPTVPGRVDLGGRRFLPPLSWGSRPARRALLIAAAMLIALAAIAGAAGVGLPGLRVLFGGGSVSPPPPTPPPSLQPSRSPSAGGPGSALHLGDPVAVIDPAALDARAGFSVRWPADPRVGRPDAAYVDATKHGQVSLVWATRADLPATLEPGVDLLLTEFLGSVDEGYYTKVTGSGTTVDAVLVGGHQGYWLSGDPHFFFYTRPDGVVRDDRRWVGAVLIWTDGPVTYRLESALGRAAAIEVAESLR